MYHTADIYCTKHIHIYIHAHACVYTYVQFYLVFLSPCLMKEEPIEYRTAEVTIACPEGLPIIKYNRNAIALSFHSPKTSPTYIPSQNETHFRISDFKHPC